MLASNMRNLQMADDEIHNGYFKKRKAIHRTSYCAFLDILGFSDSIRKSYGEENGNALLNRFYRIFRRRLTNIKKEAKDSSLFFKTFSDNVLLAFPRISDDMEWEFAFIMWALREYQFEMALKGFFIRGGLSIGPLFVGKDNVYGMALLEAYELESKVAVNPIVVLSDDVKALVDHHVGYYAGEIAPQLLDVLAGPDDRYFINYLVECVIEADGGEQVNAARLKAHKKQVEKQLVAFANSPPIFAKYAWLASYHNYFCEMVAEFPGYSDSLRIDQELSSVQFRRLKKIGHAK